LTNFKLERKEKKNKTEKLAASFLKRKQIRLSFLLNYYIYEKNMSTSKSENMYKPNKKLNFWLFLFYFWLLELN